MPGGPVRLTVSSPNPGVKPGSPLARGGAGDGADGPDPPAPPAVPPGAWVALPDRYADPQSSGLGGTVRGDTVIDLDLQ